MTVARILCLSRALSPITHMAGSVGNEALISRESVRLPDGSEQLIPKLSGNALRHCTVRSPGMRYLVDRYGLSGELTLEQLNFLFHGGALTESTGRENTQRIVDMAESWRLLRLLGGALPNQILQGCLRVGIGILACEENRQRIEAILGEETLSGLPPLLPAESFVKGFQYTTYDATQHEPELAAKAKPGPESDPRMIYAGQSIQPGAYFVHDYTLLDPTEIEVGCLLWSLNLWQESGGVIGGMSAKGHGRLHTRIVLDGFDTDMCVRKYLDTVHEMGEKARQWLVSAFGKPEKKPKKPKKGEPVAE